MLASSVKKHMKPYLIHAKRSTTIHHAFASAVSPSGPDDDESIADAMRLLGQDVRRPLKCVYCLKAAETWDHLTPLVVDKKPSGYGHRLGNLVPACKPCNSSKGSKDWKVFLQTTPLSPEKRLTQEVAIEAYHARYAKRDSSDSMRLAEHPLWKELEQVKDSILQQMSKADGIAKTIRDDLQRA